MKLVGYGRVSSEGQDFKTQVAALKAAGCKEVFAEKKSGTTTEGRVELQRAIEACGPGDVLVVVRLDRIARSLKDLLGIMEWLQDHEIGFRCLTQPIDTTTSVGRFVCAIIGAAAELENDLRKERQRIGIDAALKRGVRFGFAPKFSTQKIRHLRYVRRWTAAMVAKEIGCSERTVLKYAPGKRPPTPPSNRLSAKQREQENGRAQPDTPC